METEREALYEDFFKKLRVAFNTTSIYFKEHPSFVKAVDNLKNSAYTLLAISDPLIIGVTPSSLFCAEKYWEGEQLYKDLGSILHRRKIKTIEIRKGITLEEFSVFLGYIALVPGEILKKGGLSHMLEKENVKYLSLTELDYSELLQASGGEECDDIWGYFLEEALEKRNARVITDIADHFEKFITTSKTNIFDNNGIGKNILQLFSYLKENDRERLCQCNKMLLRKLLEDRSMLSADKIEQLKPFLQYATEKEFVDALFEEIAANEQFDALNLALFSKLLGQKYRQAFTIAFSDKVKADLRTNPAIVKRVIEIFSRVDDPFFSELYQRYLSALAGESLDNGAISFDRKLVTRNYRFLLLNLLKHEKKEEIINRIVENILKEFEAIIKDRDFIFLKTAVIAMEEIRKSNATLHQSFEKLEGRIYAFVEDAILHNTIDYDLNFFIDYMQKSTVDVSSYIDKICAGGDMHPCVVKLFFKFFPAEVNLLFQRIRKKVDDISFMKKFIDGVRDVDNKISFNLLKDIFYACDSFLKLEILRALRQASYIEVDFLYTLLQEQSVVIKKQALVVLAKDQAQAKKAAGFLLDFSDQFWFKNKTLEENAKIIGDIGLSQAREYLVRLTQRRFFWNRNLRVLAKRILGDFDARKD